MSNLEALWIEQVRDARDSTALFNLVDRYNPMIDNMLSQYYVRSYERSDWYQEASVICQESCDLFDGSTGSKFGSFFKMKFKHRVIDLIRYENAAKRKANNFTEPIHDVEEARLTTPSHIETIEYLDHIQRAAKEMTRKELIGLRFSLGKLSLKEACRLAGCDHKGLLIITYRCKKKIKEHCDELFGDDLS
ncbi:RNA polymerase sigma factor SigI [Companilactobacillus paralimentarius]